ncbi:hypothetical protein FACS1894155_11170 [Bacteroidia bacterium]|nr:hypothetical protein FACS1894155_11170 [Bacteroidia bacterium]
MHFMRKFFLYFALLSSFVVNAQENRHITGFVYDKVTGETLISASVYYDNSSNGTITNREGEFIIEKIPDADSLVFSYVGYATKKYETNKLPQRIELDPLPVDLSEVIVKPFDVKHFVRQVWKKYNRIYLDEKNNKNNESAFFYRQITQTDSIYNEFIECFFTAENTYCLGREFLIKESRYAKIKPDSTFLLSVTDYYSNSFLYPFLPENPSKKEFNVFIQPNFDVVYDVSIDNRLDSQEGNIIVLNFIPKKKTKINALSGKLYVRESDFAIIKMDGIHNRNLSDSKIKTTNLFCVNYKDTEKKGYPIVESVNCISNYTTTQRKRIHNIRIISTLFAVDMKFEPPIKITKTGKDLLKLVSLMPYNPEFWKNNPIIKRTPVDEKIIKSFEDKNAFGTMINGK